MARINLRLGRFTINFNKGVSKLSDTRVQEVVGKGVKEMRLWAGEGGESREGGEEVSQGKEVNRVSMTAFLPI